MVDNSRVARSVQHLTQDLAPEPGVYWFREVNAGRRGIRGLWNVAGLADDFPGREGVRVWYATGEGDLCRYDWQMVGHEIVGPIQEPPDVD